MKKIYLIIALAFICHTTFAQQVVTYDKKIRKTFIPALVSKTNSGIPIYIKYHRFTNVIYPCPIIDNAIVEKTIKHKGYKSDDFYNFGNDLYGIFTYEERKDVCGITIGKADLNEKKPTFNMTKIAEYSGDHVETKACLSDNGEWFGFFSAVFENKNIVKGIHLMVTDIQGKMLWQNSINTQFKGESFYINDIHIDDSGEMSIVLNSKTRDKTDQVSNQEIMFIIANSDDLIGEIIDFTDYNITSAKSLLKSDGNYMLAAYGQEIDIEGFKGCFYTEFNTEEHAFGDISRESFGDVVERKQGINDKMTPKILYLIERPDGSVTALGELQSAIYMMTNSGNYYVHHTGDIYINHFGVNGDYEFNTIQKQQTVMVLYYKDNFNDYCASYKAWQSPEGEIMLMYNDNPKNSYDNFVKKMESSTSKKNNGQITMVSIDQNNKVSGKSLFPNEYLYIMNFLGINHGNAYCLMNHKNSTLKKFTIYDEGSTTHLSNNSINDDEEEEEDNEDEL